MDVNYFLLQRTQFIKHFYSTATAPMVATKSQIEHALAPYDDPPYDESGEPAYLFEWLQADAEIEVVGRAAVSMLSESLKQFLQTWETLALQDVNPCKRALPGVFAKQGFVAGYVKCFGDSYAIDWTQCPADLSVIEQVVLARNDAQHHGKLTATEVEHSSRTRERFPRPFFMRPEEPVFDGNASSFMSPSIHINGETLHRAIEEVERFCVWFQERIEDVQYGKRRLVD